MRILYDSDTGKNILNQLLMAILGLMIIIGICIILFYVIPISMADEMQRQIEAYLLEHPNATITAI